jgi:hypothetical protein
MLFIAHRGNIDGPNTAMENHPVQIESALSMGFHVEVDVWYYDGELYLGHNTPEYRLSSTHLRDSRIWFHAKNLEALVYLNNEGLSKEFFWHQDDDYTLTSGGMIWTYPGKKLMRNSIAVMPEQAQYGEELWDCYAICTDYVLKYKEEYESRNID